MLQRLAQFRVALLQFFEEADVLDGDDGLVGEGLEKRDLLIGEGTNLGSANLNRADGNSFAKQWRNESGARTGNLLTGFGFRILGIEQWQDIVNVNRLAVDNRSASGVARLRGRRLCAIGIGPYAATCSRTSPSTLSIKTSVASHNRAALSATASSTGCNVRRRGSDDAADFTCRSLLFQSFGEIAVAFLQLFE